MSSSDSSPIAPVHAAVLIGADGIFSRLAKQRMASEHTGLTYTGVLVVLGIAQRDIDHTALKHIFAAIDDDSSGLMSMEELVDFVEGGGAEEETGGDGEGDSPVNGVLTGGRDRSKSPVAGARSKSPVAGEKSGSSPILWEKVVRVPVSGTKGGAQAPAPELLSPTP